MNGSDAPEDEDALSDVALNDTDYSDLLSKIYVRLLALKKGYEIASPDTDRTGVDIVIKTGGTVEPLITLDIQCKGTCQKLKLIDGEYKFSISRTLYDKYRKESSVELIVVLVQFPQHPRDSIHFDIDNIDFDIENVLTEAKAHYAWTREWRDATQSSNVTVGFPIANKFDPEGLTVLLDKLRREHWDYRRGRESQIDRRT